MKIAISGLNNSDNPAPGIGVAKSLLQYPLIGLSYDPTEPGIYQDIFEHVYLMPYPSLGFEALKERLEYIKEKSEIDILLPTLDAELPQIIKYQNVLQNLGISTCVPTTEQFELREKKNLQKLCQQIDIKHPFTIEIASLDDLINATKTIGFPLFIKGNYYKAYRANSLDEAIEYFYKISHEWGFPLLVQSIVNGEEINYVGVAKHGQLLGGVGIKKLTTTDLGKVWSAVSINNKTLLESVQKFVQETNWHGPFEFEAIYSTNEIYLIEINPRFPAWTYFATQLGINLPQMVIDIISNHPIEPKLTYPEQKMYMRYVEEKVCDFSLFSKLIQNSEL
ncbi:ATP-grasp domain-containing protein [Nitratiruptor sp. SB155-2]|uniref:ATP-grasp domain-containing protein n=1 Tax=Nitratiruptor sp. (strain SB155-2) TaxID=387092 RepID=UPI0001586F90|nr:ATP-grasp domain-containing protein [Nitratiruptor sp. SB155-2]BAF69613.1 conserved hypothetical protein [Nitratiruptor sp. SB155-2]